MILTEEAKVFSLASEELASDDIRSPSFIIRIKHNTILWRFIQWCQLFFRLTHWGRVTHICVSKLTNIVSYNGLSPSRRQAIIWTKAGILLIGLLGTNFSEILIGIQTFSFKKMRLKMSSAKWRPSCLGLNVLTIAIMNTINTIAQDITFLQHTMGSTLITTRICVRLTVDLIYKISRDITVLLHKISSTIAKIQIQNKTFFRRFSRRLRIILRLVVDIIIMISKISRDITFL